MVCISCILIPLALYIWHRFLQPVFLKVWNPFGKVEDQVRKLLLQGVQKFMENLTPHFSRALVDRSQNPSTW